MQPIFQDVPEYWKQYNKVMWGSGTTASTPLITYSNTATASTAYSGSTLATAMKR